MNCTTAIKEIEFIIKIYSETQRILWTNYKNN